VFVRFLKSNLFFQSFSVLILAFGRLPTFFRPHWNFDEGVYLTVAQDLNSGFELYAQTWDHKPPLIYWFYSLLLRITQNQYWIFPVANFVLAVISFALFFQISKFFLNKTWQQKLSSIILLLAFSFGAIETFVLNGENLFLPLVLLGFYFLLQTDTFFQQNSSKQSKFLLILNLILVGVFFALASLTKIHALVEIIGFSFGFLLLRIILPHLQNNQLNWQLFQKFLLLFLPISVFIFIWMGVLLNFSLKGNLQIALDSIFFYNSSYVDENSKDFAYVLAVPLHNGAAEELDQKGITHLELRIFSLIIFSLVFTWISWSFKTTSKKLLSGFWALFNLFAVLLSGRNYSHYLVQALPIIALSLGILLDLSQEFLDSKLNLAKITKLSLYPSKAWTCETSGLGLAPSKPPSQSSKLLMRQDDTWPDKAENVKIGLKAVQTLTFLIWLTTWQFFVPLFANGYHPSLDVRPLEISYTNFYRGVAKNDLSEYRGYYDNFNFRWYPIEQIEQTLERRLGVQDRFWHYSNMSSLNYRIGRPNGYTVYLWFHFVGEQKRTTLIQLAEDKPKIILIDTDKYMDPDLEQFLQSHYFLAEEVADKFDSGRMRFQFWELRSKR